MSQLPQLPECGRCHFYTGSSYLPCAVHPYGAKDDRCLDYRPDPQWEGVVELDWQPDGASYYNGELILTPEQRWTSAQRWALLDWHPLFTGHCPHCEGAIRQTNPPRVHWDCPHCDWKDDSV